MPTIATQPAIPRCPHFGVCGGCQLQDVVYEEQLRLKQEKLRSLLGDAAAGIPAAPAVPAEIAVHSAEPYEYRNRIRLRLVRMSTELRFGYNERGTTTFLPIVTCPIAAPALWSIALSLLAAAADDRDAGFWMSAAHEVEIFCNHDASQVQLTLLCAPRTRLPQGGSLQGSFAYAFNAFQRFAPQGITLVGAGAIAADPRTGPTGRTLAEAGAAGLNYRVAAFAGPEETYWISRGGFFQVNRFLLAKLVELVCAHRSGTLVWDLFSGVGLFSRVLARNFAQVTAVEANPSAVADLAAAFRQLGPHCAAVVSTALDFLQRAVMQRDRPDLVVLDPPRAGAGEEACALLNRIAPREIVYVSCDPSTLARDLGVLQREYAIAELHLVDLFPQTWHIETVVYLRRRS